MTLLQEKILMAFAKAHTFSRPSREACAAALAELARLRADLAAAKAEPPRPSLVWTRKRPTETGWYWVRLPDGWPTIMRVDQPEVDHPRIAFANAAEFAGPILAPEEPPCPEPAE